jgi:hypothetical protein
MVDVMAGIDVAKHEAYWSFTTIDLTTGEIKCRTKKVFRIEIQFQGSEIRHG